MNGVTRFLSRRDKNGEKRHSKRAHARSKVLQPLLSSPGLDYTCGSLDGPESLRVPRDRRRGRDSLVSLYQKLPPTLQPTDGGFLLRCKRSPCADVYPFHVQVSISNCTLSDQAISQSRPLSSDLYTIFSNEEVKFEKEDEKKKVRLLLYPLLRVLLTIAGTKSRSATHECRHHKPRRGPGGICPAHAPQRPRESLRAAPSRE
jgi:hypothetical protein